MIFQTRGLKKCSSVPLVCKCESKESCARHHASHLHRRHFISAWCHSLWDRQPGDAQKSKITLSDCKELARHYHRRRRKLKTELRLLALKALIPEHHSISSLSNLLNKDENSLSQGTNQNKKTVFKKGTARYVFIGFLSKRHTHCTSITELEGEILGGVGAACQPAGVQPLTPDSSMMLLPRVGGSWEENVAGRISVT